MKQIFKLENYIILFVYIYIVVYLASGCNEFIYLSSSVLENNLKDPYKMHICNLKKNVILSEYIMLGKKHKKQAQHPCNPSKQRFL